MTNTIDVEVKGLIELQRKTIQMAKDLHGAPIVNAMQESTLLVTRDARIAVPVNTGNLRDHILPRIDFTETEVLGVVGTNVEYGPAVEFGTRAHEIRPKNLNGVLAFEWKNGPDGPGTYFFRFVMHPVTRPRPYLIPAFEKNEGNIRRRFENAVEVIVNK
jgi:hypothetical protein